MKKQEFLDRLKANLWSMPEADQQRSVDYYTEMIDDRMEDGLSEEEAVAAIGELDEIVKQILTESPRPPQVVQTAQKQKTKQDNSKVWLIILLILGSPVWVPIITGLLATAVSVYVSLWAVVISLYATFIALAVAAVGCIVGGFFTFGGWGAAIVTWGAALLCAGLAILIFMLSNLAAKGMVALTKLCVQGVRSLFDRKERTV